MNVELANGGTTKTSDIIVAQSDSAVSFVALTGFGCGFFKTSPFNPSDSGLPYPTQREFSTGFGINIGCLPFLSVIYHLKRFTMKYRSAVFLFVGAYIVPLALFNLFRNYLIHWYI